MFYTPDDIAGGKPADVMAFASRNGKWEGALTRVRKNGEKFTARVVVTLRRDLAGHHIGFLLSDKCARSGCYRGRRGIYELLVIDDALRGLIHTNASEAQLLETGRAAGMRTMREDTERWLRSGITSLEEGIRVGAE